MVRRSRQKSFLWRQENLMNRTRKPTQAGKLTRVGEHGVLGEEEV
jgi:hypothetical protein